MAQHLFLFRYWSILRLLLQIYFMKGLSDRCGLCSIEYGNGYKAFQSCIVEAPTFIHSCITDYDE